MTLPQAIEEEQVRATLLADWLVAWTGGIDFLRLCICGIHSVAPAREWNALLTSRGGRLRHAAGKLKRWILRRENPSSPVDMSISALNDVFESIGSRVNVSVCAASRRGIADAMHRMGSDVLFPCINSLGPSFPLGWVGYIPDLQHKHLPHLFSEEECARRDENDRALLADARAVLVNSRFVLRDIEKFYPDRTAKVFALPFCPPLPVSSATETGGGQLSSYRLPDKYFLISNQFWVHKSHQTAFAALRIVREAGYGEVHIVCTGNTHDYRWPDHFQNLMQGLQRDRLTDRVHFLGVVPKLSQLAIMRRSLAVIQATLFEGGPGGGAVYDAVATATPAIISDIAVNREVDLGVIDFFSVGSAEDLAAKMIHHLRFPPARLDADATLSMLRNRQRQMGEALLEALQFARIGSQPIAAGEHHQKLRSHG